MFVFLTNPSGSITRPVVSTAHTLVSFRQHHPYQRTAFKISVPHQLLSHKSFLPPRSTFLSYPIMSPSPPNFTVGLRGEFLNYTNKVYQSGAFSYPRKCFAQLQTFHLTLPMLMINIRETFTLRQCCDRRSTTRTITVGVSQPRSTLTTQPSFHYVKGSRAKDARRHGLVRQLFARNSKPIISH